jgi:signal peptidase I
VKDLDRFLVGVVGLFVGCVVAGLLLAAVVPLALGWTPSVVVSGSMAPGIHRGDVVVVQWTDGIGLHPGQIVTFDGPQGRTTHRIVSVLPDGRYLTKGDGNAGPDSTPVTPSEVVGVVRLVVPYAGRFPLAFR